MIACLDNSSLSPPRILRAVAKSIGGGGLGPQALENYSFVEWLGGGETPTPPQLLSVGTPPPPSLAPDHSTICDRGDLHPILIAHWLTRNMSEVKGGESDKVTR